MSAFSNDDTYNVVAEHVIEALQLDTKLGSGGALEIKLWEQELREDAASYNDNELPAIAVAVRIGGEDVISIGDRLEDGFIATIMTITGGGRLREIVQEAKRIAARVERVMRQQHLPDKQLNDLPADLDGGVTGSVEVSNPSTEADGGEVDDSLRGVAVTTVSIAVEIDMPED